MQRRHLLLVFLLVATSLVFAQRRWGRGWGRDVDQYRTAREIPQHGDQTPTWTNEPGFEQDAFTFVRIKRDNAPYTRGASWDTDLPDSDLNLSYRLQQMTSMRVNPDGLVLRLTEKELADHPFIYMVEPGSLYLSDREGDALRNYLLNGGFLWLDDFWGESEWDNVEQVMGKVFPDRRFVELSLTNKLYSGVFQIKSKGQVPNRDLGTYSEFDPEHRTWERPDAQEVHHRALFDDQGRMMVFATHNTDNGDGWEWESDNRYYFAEFAEKIAYPLAINVLFYAMTH